MENINKTHSSYQKDINRLRKRCNNYQKAIRLRNKYLLQSSNFIKAMIKEGKITKEDLKPYFKKKSELIKEIDE